MDKQEIIRNGIPISYYQYPNQKDPLIRIASRAGKTYPNTLYPTQEEIELHLKEIEKVQKHMHKLDTGELRYWAGVILIRPEWCGASGTGAYIAVASRIVNDVAMQIFKERAKEWKKEYGNTLFVVDEKLCKS